jgi:prophage antirepressor-like protein
MNNEFSFQETIEQIQEFTALDLGTVKVFRADNQHPYFDLIDVCNIIGFSSSAATSRMKQELIAMDAALHSLSGKYKFINEYPVMIDIVTKKTSSSRGFGGNSYERNVTRSYISESGMYHIIGRASTPNALLFNTWVSAVLLPKVRQVGAGRSVELLEEEIQKLKLEVLNKQNAIDRWENYITKNGGIQINMSDFIRSNLEA